MGCGDLFNAQNYGRGLSIWWGRTARVRRRVARASIVLIDAKTKDAIWACEVHDNSHGRLLLGTHATRGPQSLAEACAKHRKEFIGKGK